MTPRVKTSILLFLSSVSIAPSVVRADPSPRALAQCLDEAHERFRSLRHLLEEARRQRRVSTAGSPERQAADAAIERIAQRTLQATEHVADCVRRHAPRLPTDLRAPTGMHPNVRRDASGRPIVEVDVPPDPRERAVADDRDEAVRLIARDTPLAPLVHLQRLERVDGTGRTPRGALLEAARRLGPPLRRCYETLMERRGLQRGEAVLAVVVAPNGRARRVHLDRVGLGGPGFRRCLLAATRTFRVGNPPRGGWVGYQLMVHFGERDEAE